jgi:hypothetical protein
MTFLSIMIGSTLALLLFGSRLLSRFAERIEDQRQRISHLELQVSVLVRNSFGLLQPSSIARCDEHEHAEGDCEHCDYDRATGDKPTALPVARMVRR